MAWGLFFFWFGENACALNYLIFQGKSDLWEYFHNYGMAAGFSFVAYAFIEGLDRRVIHHSTQGDRCALFGLCRVCIKYTKVECALEQIFRVLIPALLLVTFLPLSAELRPLSYDVTVLGKATNYSVMLSSQLFEIRYCPFVAFVFLASAWLVLLFKRKNPVPLSKILLAVALGPLSFGLMRLFLAAVFQEDLSWFNTWEELTELVFIVAVARVLWLFRKSLFAKEAKAMEVA